MDKNFNLLLLRVIDTLDKTDLEKIKEQLKKIKGNTITTGAGGSFVVSDFSSKIILPKGIIENKHVRDIKHMNLDYIENILICSYSGTKTIIDTLKQINKKLFLLTNNEDEQSEIEVLNYISSINKEKSFISLASTLMPMAILLSTYKNMTKEEIIEIIKKAIEKGKKIQIKKNNIYEILSGIETSTSTTFLETTMTESGIAIPLVHDKYDYCHGRNTTSYKNKNGLIYFDTNNELDKCLLSQIKEYYNDTIVLDRFAKDDIINDFYQTIVCMFLTKKLAENKKIDLSNVEYSNLTKKLYKYKGEM